MGACGDPSTTERSADVAARTSTTVGGRTSTTSSATSIPAPTGEAPTKPDPTDASPPPVEVTAPRAEAAGACLNDLDATALLQSEGKPDSYRTMAVTNLDCRDDWALGDIDDGMDEGPGIILFRRTSGDWRFLYGAWSPRAVCDVAVQEAAPEWVRDAMECWAEPNNVVDRGDGSSSAAFRTPSGNIMCNLMESRAECVVLDNSWDLPAPPAECVNQDIEFGSFVLFRDGMPAELSCRGDAPAEGPVLSYGRSVELGSVACRSEEDGVTCTDSATGHGFKVNRASYDLY